MSVQTQIDRISGAVSAALTALAEKGVTVPAGTKVDGLAALIASIEAGGGGSGGRNVNAFLQTFATNTTIEWMKVEHNSGFVPTLIAILRTGSTALGSYELISYIQCYDAIGFNSLFASATTLESGTSTYAACSETDRFEGSTNDENTTTFYFYNNTIKMKAGVPYLFLFANVEV